MNDIPVEIIKVVNDVAGFLAIDEGVFLYKAAKKCEGKGVAVEIGSWQGKSTICFALGIQKASGIKFYAIDPHTGSPEHQIAGKPVWTFDKFVQNLKAYNVYDLVTPLCMTSQAAAGAFKEEIEFLFIDGAHEYESVSSDFNLWAPYLMNGGVISFHDSACEGVRRLIREKIYRSTNFTDIGLAGSILYARKVDDIGVLGRIKNIMLLLLDYVVFVYYRFQVPGLRLNIRKRLLKGG